MSTTENCCAEIESAGIAGLDWIPGEAKPGDVSSHLRKRGAWLDRSDWEVQRILKNVEQVTWVDP